MTRSIGRQNLGRWELFSFIVIRLCGGIRVRLRGGMGCPAEWVEPELQGAHAVECTVEGRGPKVCRTPQHCRLDLYILKAANLPWLYDRVQGFRQIARWRSLSYLHKQVEEEQIGFNPALPGRRNRFATAAGLEVLGLGFYKATNVPLAVGRQPQQRRGEYGGGRVWVEEFDRRYLTALDYLSLRLNCRGAAQTRGVPVVSIAESPVFAEGRLKTKELNTL